jgi:hypothetical protein
MHSVILQELAAEHLKAMTAPEDVARRARLARRAQRARTSEPVAWTVRPGPSITLDESAQLSAI